MAGDAQGCPVCRGTGYAIERRDGIEVAVVCGCRRGASTGATLAAARVPARYEHCTIDGFEVWSRDPGSRNLQARAQRRTREFVDCYPDVDKGLLFMGSVGTGKTHLAVAALRELVRTKGARGLYVNALDLVQELQMAFDGGGASREEVLRPVTDSELLVLDELGAGRLTEWVRDLLYYVINARYMSRRVTVFTTNFLDAPQPPRGDEKAGIGAGGPEAGKGERWQETLADRISERLRSRLYEMADVVELRGEDYRARHGGRPGGRR